MQINIPHFSIFFNLKIFGKIVNSLKLKRVKNQHFFYSYKSNVIKFVDKKSAKLLFSTSIFIL